MQSYPFYGEILQKMKWRVSLFVLVLYLKIVKKL